jgi:PAS domain S-box-containing protein
MATDGKDEELAGDGYNLFETQTDLVCQYLPDTTLTFVNNAYCRAFGKTRQELIGRKFLELIPKKDQQKALDHIESLSKNPRAEPYEHEVILPDGKAGWQQWIDYAIFNKDGKIVEFQAIGRDITERKQSEEALRKSREELRKSYAHISNLAGRLLKAQEEERRRIARELHDDLSQKLAALSLFISNLKQDLPESREIIVDRLSSLYRSVIELSKDVRALSHRLHPAILEHAGLAAALEALCSTLKNLTGIEIKFTADGIREIPEDVALCLYRVAQESLHNIVVHSDSLYAQVKLIYSENSIYLYIIDSGRGFDLKEAKQKGGLGLFSMEERVRLLGGNLEIESWPGQGAKLTVYFPLQRERL